MTLLSKAQIATQELEDRVISYQDWAEKVLGSDYRDVFADEYIRRGAKVFGIFLKHLEDMGDVEAEDIDEIQELTEAKEQLIKERKKLQTVNLQAQEYYRAIGRNELLIEQLKESIASLSPIEIKHFNHTNPAEKIGLLVVADAHYDSNYTVKGLMGEVANVYNKDIFKTRMWSLLAKMDADDLSLIHISEPTRP